MNFHAATRDWPERHCFRWAANLPRGKRSLLLSWALHSLNATLASRSTGATGTGSSVTALDCCIALAFGAEVSRAAATGSVAGVAFTTGAGAGAGDGAVAAAGAAET